MIIRWPHVVVGMVLGAIVGGWSVDVAADEYRRPDSMVVERGYKKLKLKTEVAVCAESSVLGRLQRFAAANVPDWGLDVRDAAALPNDVDRRDFTLLYVGYADDDLTQLECTRRFPEIAGAVRDAVAAASSRLPPLSSQRLANGGGPMHMKDSLSFGPMEGNRAVTAVALCYGADADCITTLLPRIFGLDADFCKQGPVCH